MPPGLHGKNLKKFSEFKTRPLRVYFWSGNLDKTCRQFNLFKV